MFYILTKAVSFPKNSSHPPLTAYRVATVPWTLSFKLHVPGAGSWSATMCGVPSGLWLVSGQDAACPAEPFPGWGRCRLRVTRVPSAVCLLTLFTVQFAVQKW